MIKKLQKKFIVVSAISVFSVITLIFLVINTLNYISLNKQLDRINDRIIESGGVINKPNKDPFNPPKPNDNNFGYNNPEMPFSTRYFTVFYNLNDEIVLVNTESIYSVNNEQAIEYSKQINKNKEKGWLNNFRYKIFNTKDGSAIVFLDGATNKLSTYQTMFISLIVLYSTGLVVLLLIILLSKRVTKPIAQTYEKQKQFITDANHELKTPLTLILANLDIAESELGQNEWLTDIRTESQRMTQLVNKLVELSRLDEEKKNIQFNKLNISDILKDITSEFKYICEKKEITIISNIENNIHINAEEALIRKLIYLLMDNATKYCDQKGIIKIILKANKNISLSIENTYQAINEIELDKLFDRFYRGNKARTFNGGFGIGLSIAQNIVNVHKASISVSKANNDTIKFTIIF